MGVKAEPLVSVEMTSEPEFLLCNIFLRLSSNELPVDVPVSGEGLESLNDAFLWCEGLPKVVTVNVGLVLSIFRESILEGIVSSLL